MDTKTILATLTRLMLASIAGTLVKDGLLQASATQTFIGAGMLIATGMWGLWNGYGKDITKAGLDILRAKVLDAAAKAQRSPTAAPAAIASVAAHVETTTPLTGPAGPVEQAAKPLLAAMLALGLGWPGAAHADTMDWVFPVVSGVLFDVTKFAYDSGLLPVVLLLLLWAGIAVPVAGIAYIGRTIWRRGAPVASAIALAIGLALVLASHPAVAQTAPQRVAPKLTGNPIQDIKAATGQGSSEEAKLTGDPVADLHAVIAKGGAKLILHLKQTYALASAPGADGVMIDPVSAPCAKALVPIVDLVVNGPKMGAITAPDPMAMSSDELAMNADTTQIEGLPVKIEKLRILRISLTSQALTIACGPLVQDEVKQAKNLIGGITSLMTGAGLLGIGL